MTHTSFATALPLGVQDPVPILVTGRRVGVRTSPVLVAGLRPDFGRRSRGSAGPPLGLAGDAVPVAIKAAAVSRLSATERGLPCRLHFGAVGVRDTCRRRRRRGCGRTRGRRGCCGLGPGDSDRCGRRGCGDYRSCRGRHRGRGLRRAVAAAAPAGSRNGEHESKPRQMPVMTHGESDATEAPGSSCSVCSLTPSASRQIRLGERTTPR